MKSIILSLLITLMATASLLAQGPPITIDKPIMLGKKTSTLRGLSEVRKTNRGTFLKVPVKYHYLPTANSLIGLHIPYVSADFRQNEGREDLSGLGDIQLMGKYQFYAKNEIGKTHRISVKTIQSFPTGEEIQVRDISAGVYQGYLGIVSGYETLKYGFSTEIGYNVVSDLDIDELRAKIGFGLPLLKHSFPIRQLNLYFEYIVNWLTELEASEVLYAQGLQYAKGRMTFEAALQWPLQQNLPQPMRRDYSLFFGTRYIF